MQPSTRAIETDDARAEVRRLESLGATRQRQIESGGSCAPSGHLFCVAPPHGADFAATARQWDD